MSRQNVFDYKGVVFVCQKAEIKEWIDRSMGELPYRYRRHGNNVTGCQGQKRTSRKNIHKASILEEINHSNEFIYSNLSDPLFISYTHLSQINKPLKPS